MIGFHFAPLRLRAGSIIEPGNWGRLLHFHPVVQTSTGKAGIEMLLARELAFEMVRAQRFGEKPSRLSCCFVLPTIEDVHKYRQHAGANVLHRVEACEFDAKRHRASLTHCAVPDAGVALPGLISAAESYWQGAAGRPEDATEMLLDGAIRVVENLS